MSKLWGGRFSGEIDRTFSRFNASLGFDRVLLEYDARAALAHLEALRGAGAVSDDEAGKLAGAIESVLERALDDPQSIDQAIAEQVEDVHSFLEREVVREVGELGLKLNTGRSRNDQVATDFRLFVRDAVDAVSERLRGLQSALLDMAEAHPDAAMPGYTHLQRAQPVLFAHYLLAFFEMFERDRGRFSDCRKRVNVCPLGSGALAGTNYPVDRRRVAETLGFAEISRNSLDAVSDRDFAVEFTAAAGLAMSHLSRLSEDLILYATSEFGFVELGDAVTTGSSLMPQKKNPDALELIRGKSGRVTGHLMSLLTTLKGLPSAYDKDLQEDKQPVFDTAETLLDCLAVMAIVLGHVSVRREKMAEAAASQFMNATELADYLAGRGVPFRQAHEIAGLAVREALGRGCRLEDLSLDDFRRHHPAFDRDLYEAISLKRTLEAKDVPGGTAPRRVREALKEARRRVEGGGR